jgi:ectoine hydroxylase-related dioxygenase (phytanoyl-CoA dioxygenase family)
LDFERDGATVLKTAISENLLTSLRDAFSELDIKIGSRPFEFKELVRPLIGQGGCFHQALCSLRLTEARPVRILAFDKTVGSNWNLGWHQDRVVALKEKHDVPDFTNWTVKSGITHAEAPEYLLKSMFNLRLHLDDCGKDNGALKILPASNCLGKLTVDEVFAESKKQDPVYCEAMTGQILAMHALTVHASEPSSNPNHRRVLHIDFCSATLPYPLEWAWTL